MRAGQSLAVIVGGCAAILPILSRSSADASVTLTSRTAQAPADAIQPGSGSSDANSNSSATPTGTFTESFVAGTDFNTSTQFGAYATAAQNTTVSYVAGDSITAVGTASSSIKVRSSTTPPPASADGISGLALTFVVTAPGATYHLAGTRSSSNSGIGTGVSPVNLSEASTGSIASSGTAPGSNVAFEFSGVLAPGTYTFNALASSTKPPTAGTPTPSIHSASFNITDFTVTALTPEPAGLGLLVLGGASLLSRRRRPGSCDTANLHDRSML